MNWKSRKSLNPNRLDTNCININVTITCDWSWYRRRREHPYRCSRNLPEWLCCPLYGGVVMVLWLWCGCCLTCVRWKVVRRIVNYGVGNYRFFWTVLYWKNIIIIFYSTPSNNQFLLIDDVIWKYEYYIIIVYKYLRG